MLTLNKVASVLTPSMNKARSAFLSTKNALAYVDEFGATWWYGKQRVVLDADLSASTSTTLADVTGLGFAVRASVRYGFRFKLIFRSAAVTTGLKVSVTIPASPTVFAATAQIPFAIDGAGALWQGVITASADPVTSTDVVSANTDYEAIIEGTLVNGVNAGTLQLQWATEVGASGVTPKQGSSGELWLL